MFTKETLISRYTSFNCYIFICFLLEILESEFLVIVPVHTLEYPLGLILCYKVSALLETMRQMINHVCSLTTFLNCFHVT